MTLPEMTPDEIRRLRHRLYREAVADGTVALCWLVGRCFGAEFADEPGVLRYHDVRTSLTFAVHTRHESYVCVWYKGIPVCLSRKGNWSFLPGPWTDALRQIAVRARHLQEYAEARHADEAADAFISHLRSQA